MKELLTSFLSSTSSNDYRKNSVIQYRSNSTFVGFVSNAFLVCVLLSGFSTMCAAQSGSAEPIQAQITTDAYPHNEWKSITDYTSVISAQQDETTLLLADPNLSPAQLALYTGYSKLLGYIKIDLQNHTPIETIAYNNFKRVANEAPNDPILINMSMSAFQVKYDALVVLLHQ